MLYKLVLIIIFFASPSAFANPFKLLPVGVIGNISCYLTVSDRNAAVQCCQLAKEKVSHDLVAAQVRQTSPIQFNDEDCESHTIESKEDFVSKYKGNVRLPLDGIIYLEDANLLIPIISDPEVQKRLKSVTVEPNTDNLLIIDNLSQTSFDHFSQLIHLEQVQLAISVPHLPRLFSALEESSKTLTSLYLEINRPTNYIADDLHVSPIESSLAKMKTLKVLQFRFHSATGHLVQYLANGLDKNRSIVHLDLQSCRLDNASLNLVKAPLANHKTLKKLCLNLNLITDDGGEYIQEILLKNFTLTELHIENNFLTAEAATSIARCLPRNSALTYLNVGYNNIEEKGVQAFSDMLPLNQNLTRLNLSGMPSGANGGVFLGNALKNNPKIQTIDLAHVQMSEEGVLAIAHSLTSNTHLKSLDLSYNSITPIGFEALAISLEINESLQFLNLSHTGLNDETLTILANKLQNRKTSIRLELLTKTLMAHQNAESSITSKGIDYLLSVLSQRLDRAVTLDLDQLEKSEKLRIDELVKTRYKNIKINWMNEIYSIE